MKGGDLRYSDVFRERMGCDISRKLSRTCGRDNHDEGGSRNSHGDQPPVE